MLQTRTLRKVRIWNAISSLLYLIILCRSTVYIGSTSLVDANDVTEVIIQTEISSAEITIVWNVPLRYKKFLKAYEIYLSGPLQRLEGVRTRYWAKTRRSQWTFRGLDPCGQYTLSLQPVSNNGTRGPITARTLKTSEAPPTSVQNISVISHTTALSFSWSAPYFADLCVLKYRLVGRIDGNYSSQRFDKSTNETIINVNGLHACQSYAIQIIPSGNNTDGEAANLEIETRAKVAMASNIQALVQYSNALELSAVDSNFDNKCETIIARFVCEESKPGNATHKMARQYVEGQVKGVTFKALLAPLSPYTSYRCGISLFNVAGWSPSEEIILWTLPFLPNPPEHLEIMSWANTSLHFEWNFPVYSNGNIKLYISYFQCLGPAYFVPLRCSFQATEVIPRETASLQQTFQNLFPFTSYSLQVAAQNEYGVGYYSKPLVVETAPWISDPVEELNSVAYGPYPTEGCYQAHVIITWTIPCKTNGEINTFLLNIIGQREGQPTHHFLRFVSPIYDSTGLVTYNETNLKPDFGYIVEVSVNVKNVSIDSQYKSTNFKAPAAIPRKLDDSQVDDVKVDPFASHNPTKTAEVKFPANILNTTLGTIIYVALLLSEKGCNPVPELRFDPLSTEESWPHVLSWKDVHTETGNKNDCLFQYQTTEVRWNPLHELQSSDNNIIYTIGNQNCAEYTSCDCSKFDECNLGKKFCNGPLEPATEYYLVLRFFSRSGYNDVALLEFATDSVFQLTIILTSICSCLLMALVAGILHIWTTKQLFWQHDGCLAVEDPLGDVVGKRPAIKYGTLRNSEKVVREFKELAYVATDLSYSASENRSNKNRYADILPYDKNRVLLDFDAEGSDYINASFIDGYKLKKEYIATQGPKSETTMDFWRMILQFNVRIIVMLTQYQEGADIKCHEYFPYKAKGLSVIIRKKISLEVYDRTEMLILHYKYGLKRKIEHFFFKKWPDHGCPMDPKHLIKFIRAIKANRPSSFSPIVVHCSAGVGRTGTLIALDIIMQRLKHELKLDVYETVKKLRFQRMKMVQTLDQYTFLYACAYELVRYKTTSIRCILEEYYLNFECSKS